MENFKVKQAIKPFFDFMDLADKFIQTQPIYYSKEGIWWMWNFQTHSWEMIDEIDLLNEISQVSDQLRCYESKTKTEVINALKMKARLNKPKEAQKTWIQFNGTVFDIKNDKSFKATPEYFIKNPIPYEIGETEETPEIDKLFSDWVEPEFKQCLYEILAFSCLPDYPIHRIFCLNGSGRNGKSTFLKIISTFVGKHNICSTDIETLISSRFETGKLYGKLVCIMGEINSSIFKRTNVLKKLVGEDMIGFEIKQKSPFDDYNYAKLLIATNKLPETTDKTKGFYSKWVTIDFNNSFKENTTLLNKITDQEYRNLARKSLKIIKDLLETASFTKEGTEEEKKERYEERSSPFKEFFDENCESDENAQTPFWKVHNAYVSFNEMRGFRKPSKIETGRYLTAKGFTKKRIPYEKPDGTTSSNLYFKGFWLKETRDEDEAVVEKGGLDY
tara:strand:+ start:24360 stop:25694 length:1335 start_codon:yes stop_codon:yes gene_type:complete